MKTPLLKALLTAVAATLIALSAEAQHPSRLVILHTNDLHSQIDPDSRGRGGVARRKVVIDSVRAVAPASLLIDAGDAVQGTLFFSLFKGEVEDSLMNLLGYDIQILGNHEFDNTIGELAERWSRLSAERITTNYDLSASALDGVLKPYTIRSFGDKKVGFIGINLDPDGMIAPSHSEGVVYMDPYEAANATAWHMKHNEKVDYVVVISHIGYATPGLANDTELAQRSKNIDLIIGGHSHTPIDPSRPGAPAWRVANAVGDSVVVAQNSKGGATVGEVEIDFDSGRISSRLIPIDSRLDQLTDGTIESYLLPYRHAIDSISGIVLAETPEELMQRTSPLMNLVADMVADEAATIAAKPIDLAIMNKGGIRRSLPAGAITRGMVMEMMPFDNRIVVMEIKGSDLSDVFDIIAGQGGQCVSSSVVAVGDKESHQATEVTIGGEPLDPERTYTLATVDYLAGGGDYLTPLTRGTIIANDPRIAFDAVSHWLKSHPTVKPDHTVRMVIK